MNKSASDLIKCFAINLSRSLDRRAHVEGEFRRAGLPLELVEAVDGREMSVAQLRAVSTGRWTFLDAPLFPTEIAASLSQGKVMKMILERALPSALVVEDDVTLAPDFVQVVDRALSREIQWDILKLGGLHPPYALGRVVADLDRAVIARLLVSPLHVPAYIVTARGARRILRNLLPIKEPYDVFLQRTWAAGVDMCHLLPYPAIGGALPSTVAADRDYEPERRTWRAKIDFARGRLDQSVGKRVALLRWFGWRTFAGLERLHPIEMRTEAVLPCEPAARS